MGAQKNGGMMTVSMRAFELRQIRFGMFEVDTRSGELFRQGAKIRLQNRPFQALVMLLERPGELVTREELRKRLWPGETFGDFERSLNKAINGLRAALRDHAKKPRFIETLAQRGYRFIASVEAGDGHSRNAPKVSSLAVLPLENLSGDRSQEYLADGMTEELIVAVSRIASLRVISRTSAMTYKRAGKSLPTIAEELGVDVVVEGSVARSDQRVRITAQLVHAREDTHLWSGRYERDLGDILQLQTEIASTIANQIQRLVTPDHTGSVPAVQVHPQAYEAYLKGNFFRDKMTPADLEKSIGFFTEAIHLDPTYARAYADLSQSYFFLGLFGIHPPIEMFPKARVNARKALEFDETVPAAHNALAAVYILYDWDWAAAEAECRRAVELGSCDSVAHAHYADYMSIRGRHSEAIAEFNRVIKLEPISRVFRGQFGLIFYRARRYAESIEQCRKALEIDSNYANALWFQALSLEQTGEFPAAVAALESAVSLSNAPHFRALLGRLYALTAERGKALDILNDLTALSGQRYVSPFDLALVYVGLGDLSSAFRLLEEAYQQRVFRLIELTMPMFDNLRSDVRWQDLIGRLGLLDAC